MIKLTPQARSSSPAIPARMELDPVLGSHYYPDHTEFFLYAPESAAVQLRLYRQGDRQAEPDPEIKLNMKQEDHGLWYLSCPGDLHGAYYDYQLTDKKGHKQFSADPWCVACGVNGLRSMVCDLSRTDPEGWDTDTRPQRYVASPVIW